ncbi:MAG: hypothetical protein E7296_01550 [Lachnospiraceae bacterium]|nr:hypothetical protein [Lachnospiraceae bacterium]
MSYDFEKEKREAIEAGERALSSLRRAKNELNSARSWGIFDILGGGLISSAIKHSKVSNASRYIEEARYDLKKFSNELNDVSGYYGTDFGISDFAMFADFFFDGLIADFYVQSKINNARAQVDEAISRVEGALDRLNGI